ncbi:MAG: hypothetical protein ACYS26_11770 [Planctomycetota bacterium]|jgi:hypothetical protein
MTKTFLPILLALVALVGCKSTEDTSVAPNAELDVTLLELVQLDGEGELAAASATPISRAVGGRRAWKSGFPKWEWRQRYGGTAWLEDAKGNKIQCTHISTATKQDRGISYPEGSWRRHVDNGTTIQFGMTRGDVKGKGPWYTWVRYETKEIGTWIATFGIK